MKNKSGDGIIKSSKTISILCFGNLEIPEDALALRLADEFNELKIFGFRFIKCGSPEQIMDFLDEEFFIMDVVKGIDKVIIIDDISQLKKQGISTLHDFDLGFYLKLLKEVGRLPKIRIIGIPIDIDVSTAKNEVILLLKKMKEE